MIDLRPVVYVVGLLVATLGAAMILPFLVDIAEGNGHAIVFFESSVISLFIGSVLAMSTRNSIASGRLSLQQTFLVAVSIWLVLPLFGALPFYFGATQSSAIDSVFEAMSGLTTTGSTVLSGLDELPKGVLLWRALLNWLGGIGIIVVAMVFLPELRVGGMQVFRAEAFDTLGKILPRAASISQQISVIYLALTMVCALFYMLCGMDAFDATSHAMTTVATGGFANYDTSFGDFNAATHYVASVFMIVAAIPFALYVQAVNGQTGNLLQDSQTRTFFGILVVLIGSLTLYMSWVVGGFSEQVFRDVLFNVISLVTGTGYGSADYGLWGSGVVILLFWAGLIGGCAGSTSCSVKVFRYQILWAEVKKQIMLIRSPNAVFVPRFQGVRITESTTNSVLVFFFIFFASMVVLAALLHMTGLDFITSISGAATALANIGPGFGEVIGPSGNFAPLNDTAKVLLILGMWLGRLELMAVFVLLTRRFWRG